MNEDLRLGSVLPMLDFAKKTGQSVIVLNPNMSRDPLSGKAIEVSADMVSHGKYVWKKFLAKEKCKAQSLAIVAHSAGGHVVSSLANQFKADFFNRVKCLIFTDSFYHGLL